MSTWGVTRGFVADAIADGWEIVEGTLPDSSKAPGHLLRLKKDGWVLHWQTAQARPWLWGPDRLVCLVPEQYDWDRLQELLKVCPLCYRMIVRQGDVRRYSFAGRCCPECYDAMTPKQREAESD